MKSGYITAIILSVVGLTALLFGKKIAEKLKGLFTKQVVETMKKEETINPVNPLRSITEFGKAKDFNQKHGYKETDVLTVRANNPGALFWFGDKWQGLDEGKTVNGKICYFKDKASGIRAQIITLLNYQRKHLRMTPTAIINSWAPAGVHGNKPDKYVEFVTNHLCISPDLRMNFDSDPETLAKFAFAIHVMEAGFAWIDYSEFLSRAKTEAL